MENETYAVLLSVGFVMSRKRDPIRTGSITTAAVRSYIKYACSHTAPFHPYPDAEHRDGIFSVTLSVSRRIGTPDVIRHCVHPEAPDDVPGKSSDFPP